MKNSIKYISTGDQSLKSLGLGSYKGFNAVNKENKVLCLVGSKTPYTPAGGKSVLKHIIKTTEENKCYYWKTIK